MTTFALIHGAWGSGWHWAEVPGELRAMGHDVVAPDLPCDEPDAGFDDYADVVLDALRDTEGEDVVVVGYSLGGHTAPLVAARRPVRELVYLAATFPEPGVSLNEQLARGDRMFLPDYAAGVEGPDEQGITRWFDLEVYHRTTCHDCPGPVARERFERSRGQCIRPYFIPCSLTELPSVPTRYIICDSDRLTDNSFWRAAVPEHLGVEPEPLAGSHAPMASRPRELASLLAAGAAAAGPAAPAG